MGKSFLECIGIYKIIPIKIAFVKNQLENKWKIKNIF